MPNPISCRRSLSFQILENREVLSANLPIGTNLVDNSEFEILEGDFASDWSGDPAQVETYNFVGRPEMGNVAFVANGNDIQQQVKVVSGQRYVLTFDFRLAHGAAEGQVVINGGEKTVNAVNRWQTSATVVEAESNTIGIQLLASGGDVFIDGVCLTPVEELLVDNGSFEELPNDEDNQFSSRELAGWNSVGSRDAISLKLNKEGGSEGSTSLKVDGNAELLDRVFQLIHSKAGQKVLVTFDAMGVSSAAGQENELRVRWDDQFVGAYESSTNWQSFGFIADSDSDLSRLLFREVGDENNTGDGEGPYIDNVKVFRVMPGSESLEVSEPDPQIKEFVEDEGAITLLSDGFTITNSVDGTLTGAVVKLQNMLDGAGNEILSVDVGDTRINVLFDQQEGRLRLFGKASVEDYASVLQTLSYNNLSQNPDTTARIIRVTVDYSKAVSDPLLVDVNVSSSNDRPTMSPIKDQSVTVLTTFTVQVDATDAEDPGDLRYSVVATGTAVNENDPAPTVSDTGLIEWIPNQSGNAEFTVTVEDPDGRIVRRTFNVSATLDADLPSNFSPFSGARQLSNVTPASRDGVYDEAPSMTLDLDKEYRAILHTDDGEIEILLYDNDTPITVNSFVNLARDGYFDGLTFQRVQSLINSLTEGFIAQGGDPLGTSGGGPGYFFADENLSSSTFDKPVIAMANRGVGTNTNGSQFFLTYDDKVTHLNGNHTIFGEITAGLDVVNLITKRTPGSNIPAEVIRRVNIIEI